MVDCGNPRCAQERRIFKKELLSWSRKIPLMIALEQIGADYADQENADHLANPYTSLETLEQEDWTVSDTCFYCHGELTNVLDLIDDLLLDAKNGKLDADSTYIRSLQELLPFCIKYYTQGLGRELIAEVTNRSNCSANMTPTVTSTTTTSNPDIEEPEPASSCTSKITVELKIPHILQSARGRQNEAVQTTNGKRSYTEEELEAAVSDIRYGKLGTRRASTLYGIPRSTLRNKIVRSAGLERASSFLEPENSNSGDETLNATVSGSMTMSDLVQAGLFAYLTPLPFHLNSLKEEPPELSSLPAPCDTLTAKIEHLRRMHNLNGDRDIQIKPAHLNEPKLPLLTKLIRKLVEQRFNMEVSNGHNHKQQAPLIELCLSKSAPPVKRKSTAISVDTLPHFLPYLQSFSPSYMPAVLAPTNEDLRIPSYKPANTRHPHQEQETLPIEEEPPVKPFGRAYETSRIGEALKDIIVKNLTEKVKMRDTDSSLLYTSTSGTFSQTLNLANTFPFDLGKSAFKVCRSDFSLSQPSHSAKRIKHETIDELEITPVLKIRKDRIRDADMSCNTSGRFEGAEGLVSRATKTIGDHHSVTGSSSLHHSTSRSLDERNLKEKKSRPKRGQYRKYNSQLLIEAVRAVQRGEMSVHRAGSYFGVPHSTLEYKVKERHLLRQKKPRDTNSASTSALNSSALEAASCSASSASTGSASAALLSKSSKLLSGFSSDSSTSSSSQQMVGSGVKVETATAPSAPSSPSPTSVSALGYRLHKQGNSEIPWFQPYLLSGHVPAAFDPGLSMFPQGFALNTSASELLRKLQHKVQSKSSPSSPFSSDTSFTFPHPSGSTSLREGFVLFN